MTARPAAAFGRARDEGRPALITLVVPGYPGPQETDAVFDAMVDGGADIVEVEIPFSDPLADGATIQHVVFDALAAGVTPADCIEFVRRARGRHPRTPIVFMSYLNPVLAYGLQRFAKDAAAAGADAVILTDLPPEEAAAAKGALNAAGLDLIFLAAPRAAPLPPPPAEGAAAAKGALNPPGLALICLAAPPSGDERLRLIGGQ